ncbi:MAG: hypothetical protein A3H06_01435 [Candidatus Colwellbacteria bacterium RIFCSPLOWO2_12_FULL_44_13]|uniref:DoxX family protein n=3 Tax=Candidatus Colwelliibacteriota TaxID=1817904 RepID=A0A1G1Z7E1_9BACT|nr:MAG: hypothetical protein A3F24_02245 [Candidatus Colwellbacteria bacterium RIFCSPHIGHO2_12_FULL_44_17]OGY60434.1 MAG: hypothetical protein A3I31_01050 [Candidatus Colwellbacteria bacterium RIFCSPLOWO2_02_FULL_44_20b]OGY61337.1 MAG: hypothetical protein A3H06_01435 [Candidatus Colwellbacteria bacterium RIFCSPLOWO2_12_FULL_44_13]
MEFTLRARYFFGLLRIVMGWTFLWAFLDKVFGLGFTTEAGKSWLDGVSPTLGFLKFGSHGPFASIFQSIAGNVFVDWLFMLGLLFLGVALILGIGTRVAGYAGALLVVLMWLAVLPPEHNPVIDEHIVYAFVLLTLPYVQAGRYFGFGKRWSATKFVQKHPVLE